MVEQGKWEIIFSTDSHIYLKSEEMREMDNQFGDIYGVICDHEIEIVQSLQEEILNTLPSCWLPQISVLKLIAI